MSLATDLDIHKQGLAMLDLCTDVQAHIPRAFRASMAQRVADECVEILLLICRANAARQPGERVTHLERLQERLHVVQMLLRTAHAKRLIATGLWARSIELTDSIGKQAHGWAKDTRKRLGLSEDPREGSTSGNTYAAVTAAHTNPPAGTGYTPGLFDTAAPAA